MVVKYMSTINGDLARNKHYMVCTCGDDIGLAHEQWRDIMRSRVERGNGLLGADAQHLRYVSGFDVDTKEVEADKLSRCDKRVDHIVSCIKSGTPGDDVVTGGMKWIKSRMIYPLFIRRMMSPGHFTASTINA